MNKIFQMTIYQDGMSAGSLILKAEGQYYKIGGLQQVLVLTGHLEQFKRSVLAGATPYSNFPLCDVSKKEYNLELQYAIGRVFLKLWLKIELELKRQVFEWEGGFDAFRDGCKVF